MLDPTPDRIRALREATAGDVVLLTLAPERRGAIEAIALATSLGMKVSLGHTNASAACLREASPPAPPDSPIWGTPVRSNWTATTTSSGGCSIRPACTSR